LFTLSIILIQRNTNQGTKKIGEFASGRERTKESEREKIEKRGRFIPSSKPTPFFLLFLALILNFPQPHEPLSFLSQFFFSLPFFSLFLKCKKGVNEKEIPK
jgi:hypothetical protein